MVSLKERQALAALSVADPHLKKFQLLLAGETLARDDSGEGGVREELLSAISSNDSARFKEAATRVGLRKISSDSDWCQDDYLVFLLLLGNAKFGYPLTFLAKVIDSRRNNPNPTPRKINEVFAALERQEFQMDGEFCFLKIPFLHLVGKLRLGPADARKVIQAMSEPRLFDQMSPFFKLLTQKAYDLVLTERQPLVTETTAQLIEGFEAHAKDLSLRQWWQVVAALPGRMIWAIVVLIAATGMIPILIGVGKGWVESHKSEQTRTRPSAIAVAAVREPDSNLPKEAFLLAKSLPHASSVPGKRSLLSTIETSPFSTATGSFVVEVSHPEKPILNAFVFAQAATGGVAPFTIVPVQRDSGRFRAFIPELSIGQRLFFILAIECEATDDAQSLGKRILLRPLD
jgi:hypothetical protein